MNTMTDLRIVHYKIYTVLKQRVFVTLFYCFSLVILPTLETYSKLICTRHPKEQYA